MTQVTAAKETNALVIQWRNDWFPGQLSLSTVVIQSGQTANYSSC